MPMQVFGITVRPGTNFANIEWFPVPGAVAYSVLLDNNIYSPIYTNSILASNLQPRTTHQVSVAVYANGSWSSYSKPVQFTL